MNRTFVSLVGVLALVIVSAMVTLPTEPGVNANVFILTCLLVYALCATRLAWGMLGAKLSRTTAAAAVMCVLGAPFLPLAYRGLSTPGEDSEALFAGILLSLMLQPLFQTSLNRFRAAPG